MASLKKRRVRYERTVLADMQRALRGVRIRTMPALIDEPRGLATLGRMGRRLLQSRVNVPAVRSRNGLTRSEERSRAPRRQEEGRLLEVLAALRTSGTSRPGYDMVVLDTAPTGHTLRLLAMPRAGLDWVHAFMALWLKYRQVIGLGTLAWDLVSLSRDLRELAALLGDPRQTCAVVVTRPAELPGRETRRLIGGVQALGIRLGAIIVNTVTVGTCRRCRRARRQERGQVDALGAELETIGPLPVIEAPTSLPPPHGMSRLARWRKSWRQAA